MSEFVTAAGTPLGLYPVVIVQARYGGCYEGAPWVAVHTFYPVPCQSCDGLYHFPPGVTDERTM